MLRADLRRHYDALYAQGAQAALSGQLVADAHLHHPELDTRRGLTLLMAGAPAVAAAPANAVAGLREAAPELYYYPAPDLHLTLLTPLSGQPNQQLIAAQVQAYHAARLAALRGARAFAIEFNGLTLVPAAVLGQGYPAPGLQQLREHVRRSLRAANLPLAERYPSVSAPSTAMRFSGVPAAPAHLVE